MVQESLLAFTWAPGILNVNAYLSSTVMSFSFWHTGQRPTSGGVSHQEEAGLSPEGVSDWRQGGHRQLQHQGSAPSHESGPPQEPAAGKAPRLVSRREDEERSNEATVLVTEGRGGKSHKWKPLTELMKTSSSFDPSDETATSPFVHVLLHATQTKHLQCYLIFNFPVCFLCYF